MLAEKDRMDVLGKWVQEFERLRPNLSDAEMLGWWDEKLLETMDWYRFWFDFNENQRRFFTNEKVATRNRARELHIELGKSMDEWDEVRDNALVETRLISNRYWEKVVREYEREIIRRRH